MTWTSTICVVIMATYGSTLLEEKKHGPEHRWVFAVGGEKRTSVGGAPAVEAGYRLVTLPTWRGWGLSP